MVAKANDSLPGGQFNSAGITLADGQTAPLQLTSSGQLITTASGGGGGGNVVVTSSVLPNNAAVESGGHLQAIDSSTAALSSTVTSGGTAAPLAQGVQGIPGGVAVATTVTGGATSGNQISANTLATSANTLLTSVASSTAAFTTTVASGGSASPLAQSVQGIAGGIAVLTSPGAPVKTAPAAGAAISVPTSGTAVTVFAASTIANGGFIKNPESATVNLFVDIVSSAQAAEPGTNGTTTALLPGATFYCPPSTVAVTANSTSGGHPFVAGRW